jgi:hypothetical protein
VPQTHGRGLRRFVANGGERFRPLFGPHFPHIIRCRQHFAIDLVLRVEIARRTSLLAISAAISIAIARAAGTPATFASPTPAAQFAALRTIGALFSRRTLLATSLLRTLTPRLFAARWFANRVRPARLLTALFGPVRRRTPHFFARFGSLLFGRLDGRLLRRQWRKPQLIRQLIPVRGNLFRPRRALRGRRLRWSLWCTGQRLGQYGLFALLHLCWYLGPQLAHKLIPV